MSHIEARLILNSLREQRDNCIRMIQEAREAMKVVGNQIVRLEKQLDDIEIQIAKAEKVVATVPEIVVPKVPVNEVKTVAWQGKGPAVSHVGAIEFTKAEPESIPVVGLPVCAGQIGLPMLIEGKLFSFDMFQEVALVDHKGNCLEHMTKREFFAKYTPTRLRFEGAGHG